MLHIAPLMMKKRPKYQNNYVQISITISSMDYIAVTLVAVLLSVVINTLLKHFKIPTIIGYIVTGIAVSSLFDLHRAYSSLTHVAEFGIVFLMFTIGLEFSVKQLVAMRKEVLLFGSLQLFITAILLGLLALAAGAELKSAMIIGFALALSSTAIVLKFLNEKGHTHTPYGKKSIGILLFQDLAVIPILLMISVFASENSDLISMLESITIDAILAISILYIIGKFMLEPLLERVTRTDSSEIFLATVLFITIGAAELAHRFGFTYSLGAFIAGIMLAETTYKYQVESALIPFRDLLMGLFFVTVGMQIQPQAVLTYFHFILLASLVIMAVKFSVILIFLKPFTRLRTAIKTALALGQVGEFALAVFTLALGHDLLSAQMAQVLLSATVLSMIVSVFILPNIGTITDRFFPEPESLPHFETNGPSNHIVVCGYGPMGRNVITRLHAMHMNYVILEHDISAVRVGEKRGEPIYFANAANPDILRSFNVDKAAAVIVAVGNPNHLRLICETLNRIAAAPNIIIKASNRAEEQMLSDLNIGHVIVQSEQMASLLVEEAIQCKIA